MSFADRVEKFNNSKFKKYAENVFSSYYFPFVTAAVTVLSTTFGLEPLIIWYICLSGAIISLCCKDISPAICLFVFMSVIVSMKHSPDQRGVEWCDPTFMTTPAFIAQASVAVALFVAAAVYRVVDSILRRRLKITPIFIGLCVYFVALILNGLFSGKYYFMDTLYGLGMGAIILFLFVFVSGNIVVNENTYKRIAVVFIALCICLSLQLLVTYITLEVVQNGVIHRGDIMFGWGSYNQFGMLISMCIPAWFYLAIKQNNGWVYLFGVLLNIGVAILCMSRQAILTSGLLAVICCVWYLIVADKKKKILGGSVMAVVLLAAIITVAIRFEDLAFAFKQLESSFSTGSGRTEVWKEGVKKFLHNPVFGNGFYDVTAQNHMSPGYNGEGGGFTQVIPYMCHNTVIQLLFAGGIFGLVAYGIHRVQTVISLIKNPCEGRMFLALSVCAILITSLLDNHIFYPLPLFIYSPMLAVFTASEKKAEEKLEEVCDQEIGDKTDCPADMA